MPSNHAGPRTARSSARPRLTKQAAARPPLAIGKEEEEEEEDAQALLALHRSPNRPDPKSVYSCNADK